MNALDLIYLPLAILTAPWWMGKKRSGWRERFGAIQPLPAKTRPRIMLHGVSVGETNALRELVPLLTPDVDVLVTATTDTGLARAKDLYGSACSVARYPLDLSWSVDKFLDTAKPDVVALVELEVWPNFVKACHARNIPICIINGRLSERSFRGYSRIRRMFRASLRRLEFIACQDADYSARFEALGAAPNAILLTGSMKWDSARPASIGATGTLVPGAAELASELGIDMGKPLIVAGSTGPGEEAILHAACPPGVQLLCAPRKPERFDEAAAALPGCVRRSTRAAGSASGRFLLDTIGELRKAYALADVAVVGRSFGDQYGSDPIEPIALGKPTVIGPAVADFAQIVAAFERGDGIRRATRETLPEVLRTLLTAPESRADLAARGLEVIRANQGASIRHAELVKGLVPRSFPIPGGEVRS